ncbi:MAG: DUF4261 domain-containing protein [Planctomycetes bacterium]|nr:DUF4261 domain-containing protein [Planctomycetota bacterium]
MADDLLDRFFGKGTPRLGGPPVANPRLTEPIGLQLLFDDVFQLDANEVAAALRDYHGDMAEATAELFHVPPRPGAKGDDEPSVMGLLAWERHVIKLVGFTVPMPADAVKACVRPAHFDPQFKTFAYEHKSHVMLYYAGHELDPLEQYVALAAAAGSVAYFGASFVLNETARTAIPAAVLHPHEEDAGNMLGALRGFPLPLIYCGFVKMEVEGQPGVWMRTYGCHRLGLPDLATRAAGHEETPFTFELFGNLLAYLRTSGKWFAPGDTIRVTDDLFLRVRARTPDEWYLESEGAMLVADRIGANEVNRSS